MKKLCTLIITLLVINFAKAQWESTPGPYLASAYIGMDVAQLALSGNNLCAIINDQVYLSNNNGASWMFASNGVNYVRSIAFTDSVIYAGMQGSGIYYSSNWGSTYKAVNNNLPTNGRVDALLISGNAVLAAIYDNTTYDNEVYYSTNNGSSWTLTNGLSFKNVYCLVSNGTNLFAGTSSGVYMSIDNGLNWVNIGLTSTTINSMAVDANRIFAGEGNSNGDLYLSLDNGANWSLVNNGLSPYIGSIVISNNYVYVGAYWNGVYRSNNNGSSWTLMNNGYSYINVKTIAANGNNIFAGSSDGFAVSINQGSSWYCGLKTYDLNIKSIISKGTNLVTAASYAMYKSPDNGLTWNQFLVTMNALATNDSVVLAGGNGGMERSANFGSTWSNVYGIPSNPKISNLVFKDSVSFAATLGNGIYFSENYGLNWTQRINGLTNLNINALAFIDSIVVAGSNNAGIFVSTDSGLNWNPANNGLPDTCIQALASYNNIIYAGTKNHDIYKSTDNGANWVQLNNGVSDTNIVCLYTCGVNVFAGILGRGFFMSPDNGLNWSAFNNGLMNYNINTISENGTDIFIGTSGQGTNGSGIWKRALSELPLTLSIKEITVSHRIICEGNSSTIHVTAIGGTPPYNYLWNNGSQTSSITVTPTATTTYSLTVTDSNSNITTTEATVIVKPKPDAPVITQSGDTLFSSVSNGNVWMLNNVIIYYANSNIYLTTQDGNYSVIVIENGCVSDTSNIIQVGIDEPVICKDIDIYPNPATNNITIKAPQKSTIEILNIQRQLLKSLIACGDKTKVNVSVLPCGVYFIKVKTDKGIWIKKFIKE